MSLFVLVSSAALTAVYKMGGDKTLSAHVLFVGRPTKNTGIVNQTNNTTKIKKLYIILDAFTTGVLRNFTKMMTTNRVVLSPRTQATNSTDEEMSLKPR